MKSPHTLPKLRALAQRAQRTLTASRMSKDAPTKVYHELAGIPGVTLTEPVPSIETPPKEQAERVLALVHATLRRSEQAAAREFGPGMVIREREKPAEPPPPAVQEDMLPETIVPGHKRVRPAMRAHLPKEWR